MKRRQAILAALLRENTLSVRTLADRFRVSPMTIYRDLQQLERQGRVIRTVGGAMIRPTLQYGPRWSERFQKQADVKRRLGAAAAALLREGETVLLDAGTTILEVAHHVSASSHLTVVTNSLPAAAALGECAGITVLMPGGEYHAETASLLGPVATNFLRDIHADTLLLSTAAVSLDQGLTNFSMDSVAMKRAMIAQARRVILVADYTKFRQQALMTVAPITAVHILLTDTRLPLSIRHRLEQLGIQLLLVPDNEEADPFNTVDPKRASGK